MLEYLNDPDHVKYKRQNNTGVQQLTLSMLGSILMPIADSLQLLIISTIKMFSGVDVTRIDFTLLTGPKN